MNNKKYLPLNKSDLDFADELYKIDNVDEIKGDIPVLMRWLQDYNWPPADLICEYLLKFPLITYKKEILEILNSNDNVWKYWILLRLIKPAITKKDNWLIPKVEKIMLNPSLGEKENEVDEIAQEIIDKLTFNNLFE
jgi:3-methyladenine DNA glycosylase AlkD